MRNFSSNLSLVLSIMNEAQIQIIKGDAASFPRLKSLRLQMAGAITACEVSCHNTVASTSDIAPGYRELRSICKKWSELGIEFRAFTKLYQSTSHPEWPEYRSSAEQMMRDIRLHVIRTNREMPSLGD